MTERQSILASKCQLGDNWKERIMQSRQRGSSIHKVVCIATLFAAAVVVTTAAENWAKRAHTWRGGAYWCQHTELGVRPSWESCTDTPPAATIVYDPVALTRLMMNYDLGEAGPNRTERRKSNSQVRRRPHVR